MREIKKIAIFLRHDRAVYRFVIVGIVGFTINAGLLMFLRDYGHIAILPAQMMAAEVAVLSNFLLHNKWTFATRVEDKSIVTRLWEFHASAFMGTLITTVLLVVLVDHGVQYLIALGVGGGVAMVWNFFWTRFFIWKPKDILDPEEA